MLSRWYVLNMCGNVQSKLEITYRLTGKAEVIKSNRFGGWRVIMPAATSSFSGKGLLGSRPAPLYEISPTAQGAGYFSKELINKMIIGFKRIGRTLTDIYLSPEDRETCPAFA